ncbi:MAG: ABC transporter substrate-binding protein [Alphaproteobacteria bacterium]|nr:ABC transporter substrate-binding protein [Alphaproteobacteria bacterium]
MINMVPVRAIALLCLAVLASLVFGACSRSAGSAVPAPAPNEAPQYGGELNVGSIYVTLSALSWDPADWTWKSNHDAGSVRELLFAADLGTARRNGGPNAFTADVFIPEDALRGELAESWEWEDPLTLVVHLRHGVMFPDKPGVMKSREFVADDVLFTFDYIQKSPKRIKSYLDFIERIEARDDHTVVFHFSKFNTEWPYRIGYGYYTSILPREMAKVEQSDWRTVTGTGPFSLDRYVSGNVQSFARNPDYWDSETLAGKDHQLPFVDRVTYRIIKDEATYLTALRTGKLDILEAIRWINVDQLKKSTPELRWNRWLAPQGMFIALRTDQKPFDDVRIRRALNIAVNKQEIVSLYYGGHAEMMAFPQHPDFGPYFQTLENMPASVRELFVYDPDKARRLLAEAGLPEGFEITVQVCSCTSDHMDLLPLITRYWEQIGVRVKIQPMEYASFLSAMTTKTHAAGYMLNTGVVSPTSTLRKNFQTDQLWNPAMVSDPDLDARLDRMFETRDEAERVTLARDLTLEMLDAAPYVWLPTPYGHTAWWPWVKNYGGELRAGAVRPGPIYARVWIDQEMKRELGFR